MPETEDQPIAQASRPDISRHIPKAVRDLLCIVAAGRCQMCNKFLFEHPTTLQVGNFSEAAHIVAFSPGGPRGDSPSRPEDINSIENLMLLCHDCHHTIDSVDAADHPEASLIQKKRDHEAHVRQVMDIMNPERTAVVRFVAPTRARITGIPFEQARLAVFPRFPIHNPGTIIDLCGIMGGDEAFVAAAKSTIDRVITTLYTSGSDAHRAGHISVFGIAPIPLLAYFGHRLSDMFPIQLFPHDPNTNKWVWRDEGRAAIAFTTRVVREGSDRTKVAFILSLSASVGLSTLPADIDASFTVYEMIMVDLESAPGFLRQENDLDAFRIEYRKALARITSEHHGAGHIHLFAAVPPPIAVACGLDRRREVQPPIIMYQKTDEGFIPMLTINDHDA